MYMPTHKFIYIAFSPFLTGYISSVIISKRPNIKEELRKLTALLKRIGQCRLDKMEFECLKTLLLFRAGNIIFLKLKIGLKLQI